MAAPPFSVVASNGLSTAEARIRWEKIGPNATPDAHDSVIRLVLGKFWGPVPWMLEIAILLQFALGEFSQGAVIAGLLVFNAALGSVQEGRAQATLAALKSRLALSSSVRRDGAWRTIPASELVPDDVVKISLGTVVPADIELLEGSVLLDQSMLTGESLPIEGGPGQKTFAGALVRRGEAIARVMATGPRTAFGRTAELIRTAQAASSQQQAVFALVRNLVILNAAVILIQIAYGAVIGLPVHEIIPLTLTAILAAIPFALPASFTLTSALSAHVLARHGVLPTRLSAVDEAASMDILCADKTGTLTRNELAVALVTPMPGRDDASVLGLAALASSEGGQDPVDAAIRAAATQQGASGQLPRLMRFVPFDPASKRAEAFAARSDGASLRIVKGAYAIIAALSADAPVARAEAEVLEKQGFRVLAVASGAAEPLEIAGLIALSDPPRDDAAGLVRDLQAMGVRTVMVTGDAPLTAGVVARAVGLEGTICATRPVPHDGESNAIGVYAGILPEDKFDIVRSLQADGHIVGMCGDGANDAPALRQAQIGIAVSTATDIAKSAAGIVLTAPGLEGVLAAVHEGRVAFQRILTYTLRSVTRKIDQMLFLTVGLMIIGHAVLTPTLMVILMTTGDFLALTSSTDNVRPSPFPNRWRIGDVTFAGVILGLCNLVFCSGLLAYGRFGLGFGTPQLQTLAAVILVFSGQALLYVSRERRRLWHSRPSNWLMLSSATDLAFIAALAVFGIFMAPIPATVIAGIAAAAFVFAFCLDQVKVTLFRFLRIA
ncbi:MAG TPA: HAD-IC family P-type ATPase [Stellaceae bacterium]|jgi:H+-transporting ATPase|nr:HAD-IC family P-type ATPase [Stellaceae bacterium]